MSSTELIAPHRVHKVWYLSRSLSLSFPLGIEHTPVSTMRSSPLQCTHKIGLEGVVSEGAEVEGGEGLCIFFIGVHSFRRLFGWGGELHFRST